MKDKRWFFVLVVLMVLASLSIFAQTKKLRDIGRYRFIPIEPGTPAPAMMKLIAEKYADDIQRVSTWRDTPICTRPSSTRCGKRPTRKRTWPWGAGYRG